jgi:nucleotide-binding universal stress UspA family protein
MDVKKILMPTDFSECSNAALDHALFLAEHHEAELDFLHVVVLHDVDPDDLGAGFPANGEIYRRLQELASGEMKELLAGRPEHLKIREAQRRAVAAAPAIVEYGVEESVDLIVMGAHGRRGFRRFLLGSVAEEVVRLAPCAVMTLRGTGERPAVHQFRKILVPYDFSEHSKTALREARDLAKSYGGRLYLLHVIEPVMEPHPYVPLHYRSEAFELPQLVARVKEDLGPIVEDVLGADVECETEVLEGNPAWRIAEHAESIAADLVVITTHGRTGLSRFFLGSVTEKVVRSAGCPVLTLKVEAEA